MGETEALFAAAQAYVAVLYGTGIRPVVLSLKLSDGQKVLLPVPALRPTPVYQEPAADVASDIVETLQEAGQRLTTTQLLAALEHAGRLWGESHVKRTLAKMVADGRLTQEQHQSPRGYGLPGWTGG